MSFLFSWFSSEIVENTTPTVNNNLNTELKEDKKEEPIISEEEHLKSCNDKWFQEMGYVLEKHSDICYRLKNTSQGEFHLIYVVPYCYPNGDIHYQLAVKEILYPHIKTMHDFLVRMTTKKLKVTLINRSTIQIGTDENPFYVSIKNEKLNFSNKYEDVAIASSNSSL
jgi:hypothetical protein